jgi:hypothetical protein|tara:strand:+ start:78 stop:368 length:291 start_codon:yes stop_codon:yes gene_type:complete
MTIKATAKILTYTARELDRLDILDQYATVKGQIKNLDTLKKELEFKLEVEGLGAMMTEERSAPPTKAVLATTPWYQEYLNLYTVGTRRIFRLTPTE